ncbi:MAG: hypothetical protein QOH84_1532 [Kribbellaceae bacterium]|nr:hypothetical protein [Kribbellaceae bacterium]
MTDLTASIESMGQLTAGWHAMVLDRDANADVRDLPGIAVRWADSRFAFWNTVTLTQVGADAASLRQNLAQVADIMRAKEHPGFLWLFEDLLGDDARAVLPEAIAQAGLRYSFSGAGMAGAFSPLVEPVHPDLTFVRVETDEHLTAYADINAHAYGFALEDVRDGLVGSTLWKKDVYAYLAMKGDQPVACAGAIEIDGCLFVVLVATEPEWQRVGYGEAVTRKVLYEGYRATGLTHGTLQATEAGRPVYARIGLQANSPIHFYDLQS